MYDKGPVPGRNDACWCGSSKKYKKCHSAFDERLERLWEEGWEVLPRTLYKTPADIEGIKRSAAINVGETWTMSVPAGGMYDWNLSSEYIAYGPSMADKEGVLKQVGYETANGVSTITYEAMMPGTCTVTLTDRSFAKIAEATVTVTDGSAAPDTPSTENKAAETPAAASAPSAAAAVSTAPVDTRTAQQREIDEAKANGTWGIEYTTCQKCGYHNWTGTVGGYKCDHCGHIEAKDLSSYPNVKGTATLPTATSAAASNNIIKATGADMSMVVLAVLALAAALVAGFACIVRKQGLGK